MLAHSLGSIKTNVSQHILLEDIEVPSMNESASETEHVLKEAPKLSVELRDSSGVLLPPDIFHQGKYFSFFICVNIN